LNRLRVLDGHLSQEPKKYCDWSIANESNWNIILLFRTGSEKNFVTISSVLFKTVWGGEAKEWPENKN
jgi:hypothetical protein